MFSEEKISKVFEHYGIDTTNQDMEKLVLTLADLFQELEEQLKN